MLNSENNIFPLKAILIDKSQYNLLLRLSITLEFPKTFIFGFYESEVRVITVKISKKLA